MSTLAGLTSRWIETLLVRLVERTRHLLDVEERLPERERPFLLDQRPEVATLDVAHRDVQMALGLAGVVDRDDVRVVEAGGELATRG